MGGFGRLLEGAAGNAVWAAVVAVSIAAWSYLAAERPHRIAVLALVTLAAVFFILEQLRRFTAPQTAPPPLLAPRDVAAEIREWIRASGASIAEERGRHTAFNFMITTRQGTHLSVYQPENESDLVALATSISGIQLAGLSAEHQANLLWTLRLGLLDMGVRFSQLPLR